jgi:large subunit ribosomal protein L18
MNPQKAKAKRQLRRRRHVRRKIVGTPERPRLTVFRSSKHIYAQLIDDLAGQTLAAASSLTPDVHKEMSYGGNIKAAKVVGQKLAAVAKEKGITKAAFDRGHYRFHGRVKALAEAANAGGLLCCQPKHKKKAPPAEAPEAPKAKAPKAEAPKKKQEKKPKE